MFKAYLREFPKNFSLAVPIMLGQLGHVLVGLVDNIMIGRLGAEPLAAVSLGNTLVFFALFIGIGFSFAITPLVAEADGEQNFTRGRRVFQNGVIMCSINGILLFALIYFIKPVLYQLDQPAEVVKIAFPYLNIVAFSLIPLMIFQGFKQFADGLSLTKYAMYATLIANFTNIVLNYFLIYGKWIFPRLEVEGAAIATLSSRLIMLILIVFILKSRSQLKPYFSKLIQKINTEIFKRLLSLGFPTALQMLFEGGIFTASVILAGTLGAKAQAANQIALNLASMTFMVAVGLGVTATIRVANQKGKKQFFDMKRIAHSIFLQILCIEIVFALLFIVFKNVLPEFYIDDIEVIRIAASLLVVAALFQISDGLQAGILGALRGLQDVKIPTFICFVSYWLIGFPISYYFGKQEQLGSDGIWLGLLAGLSASALLLYIRFYKVAHRYLKKY
ncbi:MAG: MATE family efflux transporter [Bacteroidetes bacterium]|jgi:MATE family multidrug resistance protein|nr:MATE family efflux transporter [Bacteroidota bacterium]